MHLEVEVTIEAAISSDHTPLLIKINTGPQNNRPRGRFFYEARWGLEKECKTIVKQVWHAKPVPGNVWLNVKRKLECYKRKLMLWQKKCKGSTEEVVGEKNVEIAGLQAEPGRHNLQKIKQLQQEVHLILEQEDLKWRKRSKENWLKNGDRNTKYFHACANQKRKKSCIDKMSEGQGRVWSTQEAVGDAFIDYFINLLHPNTLLRWGCVCRA